MKQDYVANYTNTEKNSIDEVLDPKLTSCKLFASWKTIFLRSGCAIISAVSAGEIKNDKGKVLRRLIAVKYSSPEGIIYRRNILLKEDAVIVIPVLISKEEKKFVTVQQRKVIDGNYSTEFPSGGVAESKSKIASAVNELHEETGIKIQEDNLYRLAPDLVLCESSFNETVTWYYCIVSKEHCPVEGSFHGINSENEYTQIKFLSEKEISKIPSFHMATACELLKRAGIISNFG